MRALIWLLALATAPAGMVLVPAGDFVMGSDRDEADERPAHRVMLSAFFIDQDEVTVAAYGRCVAAGQCMAPRGSVGAPEEPVVWVSWRDAAAYCRFVGKRLPTEAEWEKAARGGDARRFPWGNAVDCPRANFGNYLGEGQCPNNPGRILPVGRAASGASPYGVRDLAGNVWEWVADEYDPHYYARSPYRDPRGPEPRPGREARKGLRGGACCSMFGLPRASNRLAFPADFADNDIGFRCAADVK
ncbi:MAG TPA: SUMF1/EgtB/PvdO family nonheme iron enzyme [Polyangia bacterium]|jgi:formylglycine-generating enzyme required for sulfatase activity|nr:SUMF1/EgtB/PvdO family nonheme iron enzyme [Polyangia bacterium]